MGILIFNLTLSDFSSVRQLCVRLRGCGGSSRRWRLLMNASSQMQLLAHPVKWILKNIYNYHFMLNLGPRLGERLWREIALNPAPDLQGALGIAARRRDHQGTAAVQPAPQRADAMTSLTRFWFPCLPTAMSVSVPLVALLQGFYCLLLNLGSHRPLRRRPFSVPCLTCLISKAV